MPLLKLLDLPHQRTKGLQSHLSSQPIDLPVSLEAVDLIRGCLHVC